MKLPELEHPERYSGLYVFDFGEQVAVGYTADEIAVLIESGQYQDGKVYRIHRALPDGTMELQGIPRERFTVEEAILFFRHEMDAAKHDFEELERLAESTSPPCRMKAQLVRLEDGRVFGHAPEQESPKVQQAGPMETCATVVIYPAEYTNEVSRWLSDADYRGGDFVEGGVSAAAAYYASRVTVVERRQWWPAGADLSRSAEEVLATTHQPVQRRMVG